MSVTTSIIGLGTTIGFAATGGSSFASLGELVDVKMPEVSVGKADATHYLSPANTKEFISTVWKEYADVDFEINYFKTNTVTINGIVGGQKDFKITLPDASTFAFPGFVSKVGGETPNMGKISQKGSITITGAVVFAAGA